MPTLRFQTSGPKTGVFVDGTKVPHVQKITITEEETVIFFPPPSLSGGLQKEIELSMALVRTVPRVLVGHILTEAPTPRRVLGKIKNRRRRAKAVTSE